MPQIKERLLVGNRITFLFVMLVSVAVLVKILWIQQVQKKRWQGKAFSENIKNMKVEAPRGDIYADDGTLLATSLPVYHLSFDPSVCLKGRPNKKNGRLANMDTFQKYKDELYEALSLILREKYPADYRELIEKAVEENKKRKANNENPNFIQYIEITHKELSHHTKERLLEASTLLRYGVRGGGHFDKFSERMLLFGNMAQRSLGSIYLPPDGAKGKDTLRKGAGIEFSFNTELEGIHGRGRHIKLASKKKPIWRLLNPNEGIKPVWGKSVYTTLNMKIQDVAEASLRNALSRFHAQYGCAVVMETQTGYIRAMTNLKKVDENNYIEADMNYAIRDNVPLGSVLKLPSIMAVLEQNEQNKTPIALNKKLSIGTVYSYGGKDFTDSHKKGEPSPDSLTVRQIFAKSSNIGVVKLVTETFKKKPESFAKKMMKERWHFDETLDFQILGGTEPIVRDPSHSRWSEVSLPQMAIGYELAISPLQLLSFYNAVANNGKWVRPLIVKYTKRGNQIEDDYTQLSKNTRSENICSESTLQSMREMLEAVVHSGTAFKYNQAPYTFAGKTGTAVKPKTNGKYPTEHEPHEYHTSFAGYFPAQNPKYSIIIIIDDPSTDGTNLMAADAAVPVFRDIADKLYATDIQMHQALKTRSPGPKLVGQYNQHSHMADAQTIAKELNVSLDETTGWAIPSTRGKVPNVVGKSLRDALYLLENQHLRVMTRGRGKVKQQSIAAGMPIGKHKAIGLVLE